jgi:uncharacterized protein (DUF927 family)
MSETKKAVPMVDGESIPNTNILPQARPIIKYTVNSANIPEELKERKQWVLWRYDWKEKERTYSKVPKQPNGKNAIPTDPRTWSTFDAVMSVYQKGNHDGIGYVFSENDDYCGIDYDKIFNDNGTINDELVLSVLNQLDSYTEYSPSGKGLHTIIKGSKTSKENKVEPFECYDKERYFTFTGAIWSGSSTQTIENRQNELEWFEQELITLKASRAKKRGRPATTSTQNMARPKLTDDEIIQKATNSRSGFTFSDLFEGRNLSADESANDMALCNLLAFYTDDMGQMDRIVRQSAIYRDKWERVDYAERTMQKAIDECTEYYTGKKKQTSNVIAFPRGTEQTRTYQGYNIPDGYDMHDGGIFRMVERNGEWFPKQIAPVPILITRIARNIQTGNIEHELKALHFEKIVTAKINRGDVANAKTIVTLASQGFPIMSSNAGDVSTFLMSFEHANNDILSVELTSNQMGWQNDGKCFLLGSRVIGDNPDGIMFNPSGEGEKDLLEAIRTGGTLEGWLNAIELIKEHPKARLALYTAFVPPLLNVLNCHNFVVDFANRTSTGKTTVQRIMASTFGNPDERSGASVVGTWDATKVWIERYSATINGLPVILDDTKRAKNTQDISDIIYMVASGKERGRGNVKSTNIVRSFRTVLSSSGEVSATSYKGRNNDSNGGAKGRTLTIKGSPFERNARETVQRLNSLLMLHYGHAMPIFLEHLIKCNAQWDNLRNEYQNEKDKLASETQETTAIRLAEYGSTIRMASKILHKAFEANGTPLPFDWLDPLPIELWEQITLEAKDATKEQEALDMLQSWVIANYDKFDNSMLRVRIEDRNSKPAITGWYGKVTDDFKAIYGHVLEKWFKDMGYSKEELVYQWKDSGHLLTNKDGKTTKLVKIDGEVIRMYCFKFDRVTE